MLEAQLRSTQQNGPQSDDGYRIPAPPKQARRRWVRAGEAMRIGGLLVPGPFYAGTEAPNSPDGFEPSVIDPDVPVAVTGEHFKPSRALWVSYTGSLSQQERRGYLLWMASGRTLDEIDSRFIFMYLFGLERRATVDALYDPSASEWLPEIVEELYQLRDRYAQREIALANAIFCLLYWIENSGTPGRLYQAKDAMLHRFCGLRTYTQIAVGQCMEDGVPLSSRMALSWVLNDGRAYRTAPTLEHRKLFEALFDDLYSGMFGAGLVVPPVQMRMRLPYRAYSPGLAGLAALERELADVCDPGGATAALDKIKKVFDAAAGEIERYARIASKRPEALGTLEVLSQMPMRLWPASTKEALRLLIGKAASENPLLPVRELLATLDPSAMPSKATALLATSILSGVGLATEPPLVDGSRALKSEAPVVLLPAAEAVVPDELTASYDMALRFVDLTCGYLASGEPLGQDVLAGLLAQISTWPEGGVRGLARLGVRIRLAASSPPAITVAKKIVDALPEHERRRAAAFAVRVASVGREPTPAEVKAIGKLYSACGLDPKTVARDLHAAAAGGAAAPASAGFALDAGRIAALRTDTAKVDAMLANIFVADDEIPAPVCAVQALASQFVPVDRVAPGSGAPTVLGLDAAHAAFALSIVTHPSWSRAALAAKADEHDLMLDAAIERINDLCLDEHDQLLIEGEDPIEIDQDLLAQLGWNA